MNPQILILTGLYDFSCDYVCRELRNQGVSFFRINKEHYNEYRFTLNPCIPSLLIEGAGVNVEITAALTSVWFRQPIFLRNTPPYPLSPQEQLSRSQWSAFPRSLRVFDKAMWMNDPQRTYLAESKPYQLHLAAECGLRVPASIISNDFRQIQNIFPADLIVKSLDSVLIREKEDCLFTYSIITNSSKLNDSNTYQVPLIAQELLHPKEDLRVTIIGKEIYAVKIIKEGIGIEGDWRRTPKESLEYIDAELPSELIEQLLLFVDRMGLFFAAIDLAKVEEAYYFIEVNPTGEWGWLQSENRDIAASLARWLVNPK